MATVSSVCSPKVSGNRIQRGSVARSICGDSAVAIPNARYSLEPIFPNSLTLSGSKEAVRPMPLAHLDMGSPVIPINSAPLPLPCLGSELLLAGIPKPVFSARACILLFHRTAVSVSFSPIIST